MTHPLVGVVTSTTGALAPQGLAFLAGLELGLGHAGIAEAQLVIEDDAGLPSQAVVGARAVVAAGCTVVTGSVSSAVSLELASLAARDRFVFIAGSASTDAISGLNRWTFRSGHQIGQSAAAAAALLEGGTTAAAVLARERRSEARKRHPPLRQRSSNRAIRSGSCCCRSTRPPPMRSPVSRAWRLMSS